MQPTERKLTLGCVLLYSSASAGLNIMAITVDTWILYFYAPPADSGRHQYLPTTLIGILLTVAILWDAVIDPFIGHWSDVTRSRWGRRRPFLIFATPITAIALILIWTPPHGASTALVAIYFFLMAILRRTSYSLVGIPYDGTMPEMANTPQALVMLSAWKNVFGLAGVLIGALVAAPLFDSIGPVAMGALAGAVGLVTIWLTLAGLRETDKPIGEPIPTIEGLKATFQNTQFVYMFFSVLIVHIAYAMITSNLAFFVTQVVGKEEADVGIFMGVIILLMALSAPVWNWISHRHANRRLLMVAMVGLGVAIALNYTVGMIPGVPLMVHALVTAGLIGPLLGGYFILAYAMMGSVVDYDEMFTHSRREAIYYGTFSLAAGVGPSLAALILTQLYDKLGNTVAQPTGIRLAWIIGGAFALLGALIFIPYKLGDTPEETRKNMGMD